MREQFVVPKLQEGRTIRVEVPGSKSITNRALLLAALSNGICKLRGVLFSNDTRAMLHCLRALGFSIDVDEGKKIVEIKGEGGKIPYSKAEINVGSAGTAARFLTVVLAFAGGEYKIDADEQMKRRPMKELIDVLRQMGATVTCTEEEGHFPIIIKSDKIHKKEVSIDTETSSQFASALLIAGGLLPDGLKVRLIGSRINGSYIQVTLKMLEQFGVPVVKHSAISNNAALDDALLYNKEAIYEITPRGTYYMKEYIIEPDLSAACYFYAMAPLLKAEVIVKHVKEDTLQGDVQFLYLLKNMGCTMVSTEEGICISGKELEDFAGMTVDMKDFSDQTMTLAVLAPFADFATMILNVGHIRYQESDRIQAILNELTKLGIRCEAISGTNTIEENTSNQDGLMIYPGTVKAGVVNTYEDHRMAMAFTLIGLKSGGIIIDNPECCKKTFENYFEVISELGTKYGFDT